MEKKLFWEPHNKVNADIEWKWSSVHCILYGCYSCNISKHNILSKKTSVNSLQDNSFLLNGTGKYTVIATITFVLLSCLRGREINKVWYIINIYLYNWAIATK